MFTNYQQIVDRYKNENLNICEIYSSDYNNLDIYELRLFNKCKFPDVMTFLNEIFVYDIFSKKRLNIIELYNWKNVYTHLNDIDISQKYLRILARDEHRMFDNLFHDNFCIVNYDIQFMDKSCIRMIYLYI